MKKYAFIIVFMSGVAVCTGLWGYNIGTLEPRVMSSNHDAVQAVCDYAHNHTSGASEEACGIAQDKTHTQYTCDINGDNCRVRDL